MTTTNGAFVTLSKVSKSYPAKRAASGTSSPLRIIDDLSIDIPKASSLALTGPSGSGKTTLLNLIGTILRPDSGEVTIDGTPTSKLTGDQLARFRNDKIGFLFQEHLLLPQCDVMENILLPTLAFTDPKRLASVKSRTSRAIELLSIIGLSDASNAFPEELSGGEKQRVALVRALVNKPAVLLADEPTGALDADNAEKLTQLLFELNKSEGTTLIIATHSTSLASNADSILKTGAD